MIPGITFCFQDTFAPNEKSSIASGVRSIILMARDFIIATSDARVCAHLNLKNEHNSITRCNRGILGSIAANDMIAIRVVFYCVIVFNLFF